MFLWIIFVNIHLYEKRNTSIIRFYSVPHFEQCVSYSKSGRCILQWRLFQFLLIFEDNLDIEKMYLRRLFILFSLREVFHYKRKNLIQMTFECFISLLHFLILRAYPTFNFRTLRKFWKKFFQIRNLARKILCQFKATTCNDPKHWSIFDLNSRFCELFHSFQMQI